MKQTVIRPLCYFAIVASGNFYVQAQDPTPVFDLAIADVMATAQRTTQSIQTTPVSISAFIEEDIERYQIDHPRDLSQIAINTNIVGVSGGSMRIKPYVRGLSLIHISEPTRPY